MKKSIIVLFSLLLLLINCGKRKTPLEPEFVTLISPEEDEVIDSTTKPSFSWNKVSYAYKYELQIDDRNSFYSPVVEDSNITSTGFDCPISLSDDEYWWRVRTRQKYSGWEAWSEERRFIVSVGTPVPLSPVDDTIDINKPTFNWSPIPDARGYRIQVDDKNTFYSLIVEDSNITSTSFDCPISLSDRNYWWRVKALQGDTLWSEWSEAASFMVSVGTPELLSPVDDTVNVETPTFSWSIISNSVKYRLQIDDYDSFYSPIIDDSSITDEEFTINDTTLLDGQYYWRVRVKTEDEEWSDWSTAAWFCVNTNPFKIVAQYQTMGYAKDILVRDDTAYVAQGEGGLAIVDLTDEENPYLIGQCIAHGNASAIAVKDSFAYIAVGKNGVSTILFSDPTSPVHQSLVGGGDDNATDILIYSPEDDTMSYIYVAEQDEGMWLLQILPQYPQQPQPYILFDVPGYENGLYLDSTYLYIGCGELGLAIVDISKITVPEIIGTCDTDGYAKGLFVREELVYITDGSRGIDIIDATDKSSPFIVGSYDTEDDAKSIFLKGDTAFIADENNGLVVLDVSDPSLPQYIGGVETEYADAVWVESDYAVIADRYMGLVIVKWDHE
jgi:hypothetical protein